jgi:tetrahydromethanopterin S-methyltransferase subunit F
LHQKQHWNSKTGTWVKGTNPINKICGFATGFGGSILSFYGIAVPALYTTVVGQFSVKLPPATDIDESLRNDEAFRYGYQKKLRNRRIRQGFLASMAGFAAGILTFTFTR